MIKKFTIICMTVALLLTGSLYKPQKTEAFALVLGAAAIVALIVAGTGLYVHNATNQSDLEGLYSQIDEGTKTLVGEIEIETNEAGNAIKFKHGYMSTIASAIIMQVYNKFSNALSFNNHGNVISRVKNPNNNNISSTIGFVPSYVHYATWGGAKIADIANKFRVQMSMYNMTSYLIPTDINKGYRTIQLGKSVGDSLITLAYLPASLFGYDYDDRIAVSVLTSAGAGVMPAGITANNVIYLNDDTIAIAWGASGVPMLETSVSPLIQDINTTETIASMNVGAVLPSIGGWSPGMELDPSTAHDLANDRLNGLGNDMLTLGGLGTIAQNDWGNVTRDLVNPELELDPTMPWDNWEQVVFPVIDADVISGDLSMPNTTGIDGTNEISWRGWLVGGLAGLGSLLKNIISALLAGLINALQAIFNLVKLGFESIIAFFTSIAGTLASIYAYLMSIFFPGATWFSDILAGIQAIPSFFSGINALLSFIVRMFGFLLNMLVALIDLIAFQLFNGIINSIGTVLTSIKNIFSILPDPLDEISYRIINIASFTALLTLVLKILRIRKA